MVPVTASVSATDNSGAVSCRILSVSSNEPVSPGGDWVITGPLSVSLRADRLGNGSGRVYTIPIVCTDPSGNSSTQKTTVSVPHDKRQ